MLMPSSVTLAGYQPSAVSTTSQTSAASWQQLCPSAIVTCALCCGSARITVAFSNTLQLIVNVEGSSAHHDQFRLRCRSLLWGLPM